MQARIHILTQSPRLEPFLEQIQKGAKDAIRNIEEKIGLPPFDVVIADNPDAATPETGVGGFSPNPHLVFVWIDPGHKGLAEKIEEEVKRTITHESYHATRSVVFPWNEANLLEAFITEGLADHFDVELNNGEPYPWSIALNEDEISKYFEKAKNSDLLSKGYDHSSWFFGSEEKDIPRWTGYAVGFKLVGDHMKKTGKSAAELVVTPASDFIEGVSK